MNVNVHVNDLKFDENGLIPAIIQDEQSKAVLMFAYMNQESLQKTIATGETWFWSRSRQELWHKGATSGHTQKVVEIRHDCDRDTLLILVQPQGPACHRGTYTCFDALEVDNPSLIDNPSSTAKQTSSIGHSVEQSPSSLSDEIPGSAPQYNYAMISQLIETIAEREAERPEGAYTTYLFEKGLDKILKKVGEEASEVIIAAKNRDPEELRNESADLLYHLMVLWREQGLGLDQVIDILEQRHGN